MKKCQIEFKDNFKMIRVRNIYGTIIIKGPKINVRETAGASQ
jgi:hypothetical protein